MEERNKYSFGSSFAFGTPKLLPSAPSTSAKPAIRMTTGALSTLTDVSSIERSENKPLFTFPGALQNLLAAQQRVPKMLSAQLQMSVQQRRELKPLFAFPAQPKLESQWRDMEWTEEQKTSLMKTISSYRPICHEVTQARVLLLGPVGSGKSSFVSSVQSVFNGRVTNRAMVGSSLTSFTKKLQSFHIHCQKGEDPTGLVLCDIVGLGGGEMTGLTLYDILSVIKGHVPEGHKFSPDQPVRSETVGYVKKPSLKDKIHCVAFVVDGSKILTYPKGLSTTFQQLREHISELGVHQVALLTHVDQICPETAKDVTKVYESRIIRDMMSKAGALLGMSTSYIVPVKNYSSELDLDASTDVLLLSAVDHILQYAELYFQDNTPQHTGPKIV
ncbi:interferon-induced protein 44-like isoform X5 [Sander lucioperca]|uniref:interferon-induced protein 44-like isoform X5 n=2 Tax=Sander lucioperca TaxID=283035 RepID=UPI001653BA5B|nr:interferon-induced protein 44-like isoform X5 [Sander lucioperca]